jgi:hypothetical protein
VVRFHNALQELTGRRGIRNDVSRYEAVSMILVDPGGSNPGQVLGSYPKNDSALRIERFFHALYLRYDERYVYSAPDLKSVTRRREWAASSPLFDGTQTGKLPILALDYEPRIADSATHAEE